MDNLPPLNTPIQHTGGATCPVDIETTVQCGGIIWNARDVFWPDVTTYTIIARAPADRIAELEAENARLKAFIADFAEAKFEALRQPYCPDPQDEEDPVTEALTVWAWQEDARATLKGTADV